MPHHRPCAGVHGEGNCLDEDPARHENPVQPGERNQPDDTGACEALRHDARGDTWLSYPRPRAGFAQPVLAEVQVESPRWYHRRSAVAAMKGPDRPWVYGSGLRGEGKLIFEPMMSRHFPFAQYADAYRFIEEKGAQSVKVLIDL